MFLHCKSCLEPREVWDTKCTKCGATLVKVAPCSNCSGKGYIQGGDGPEDCPTCNGMGCV